MVFPPPSPPVLKASPGSYIALRCHVSLVSFNVGQFLCPPLSFTMSTSLKSTGQFCKCPSSPLRLMFLLEGDWKNRTQVVLFYFWQEYHGSDVHCPGGPRCQYVTSLVMLSLISWLKWCLPGFSFESNGRNLFKVSPVDYVPQTTILCHQRLD